jgi:hypothetical protein
MEVRAHPVLLCRIFEAVEEKRSSNCYGCGIPGMSS